MSSNDNARSIKKHIREMQAVKELIDALEDVLYSQQQDDGAKQAALEKARQALTLAGRPWNRHRQTLQRKLRNAQLDKD